ncbi:DoxX family protein [Segetibacter sp. 3557_3]|uniref:DoxX family protein n=1 Tax=Segetibacter sp. 3557_3 TaxID=2547429 RepID=UPI001058E87B|nr:DoxX family protein [Segetibacter sp. 3557_3]TDH25104.1 DoxX family protein [Segetibacter sp. 3557_3]
MKRLFNTAPNPDLLNLWLFIFRIAIGVLMLIHGWPKFQTLMLGNIQFADPIGLGPGLTLGLVVFAEVLCSILIIIGFATRLAAIVLIINMAVAFFVVHGSDPLPKKELALLYLLIYITLLVTGSGKYGVDSQLSKKRR